MITYILPFTAVKIASSSNQYGIDSDSDSDIVDSWRLGWSAKCLITNFLGPGAQILKKAAEDTA
jgi:hypothetical protein